MRKLALVGCQQFQAIGVVRLAVPTLAPVQPEVLKSCRPVILSRDAEGMKISFSLFAPIVELDAQFESGLGRRHELGFIDTEKPIESGEGRDRTFAHTHGADHIAFNQRNFDRPPHGPRNGGCRHPSRCSAAGDNNTPDWVLCPAHRFSDRNRKARMRPALSAVSGSSTLRAPSGMWSVTFSPLSKT